MTNLEKMYTVYSRMNESTMKDKNNNIFSEKDGNMVKKVNDLAWTANNSKHEGNSHYYIYQNFT